MTADGTLYADETCRDFAQDELDKVFGKDAWRLDGGEWSDRWNLADMDATMHIPVINDIDGDKMGELVIKNKFEVVEEAWGRGIECSPEKIVKITDTRKKSSDGRKPDGEKSKI